MILETFKMMIRSVRFLDVLEDTIRFRQQTVHRVMATVAEEVYNPPTPPADSTSFEASQHGDPASDAASRRTSSRSCLELQRAEEQQTKRHLYKRMSSNFSSSDSTAYSTTGSTGRPLSISRPSSMQVKRQSFSHRLSASVPAAQRQILVSERLNASHDTFLSYLGSFIGRLHLQSQSSADLISTVRQSVTAGRELLTVVEVICAHGNQSAEAFNVSSATASATLLLLPYSSSKWICYWSRQIPAVPPSSERDIYIYVQE